MKPTKEQIRICKTKRQHISIGEAIRHQDSLIKSKAVIPGTIHTYKCKVCNTYHVGHYPRRR